jgi:hypothetical protein
MISGKIAIYGWAQSRTTVDDIEFMPDSGAMKINTTIP